MGWYKWVGEGIDGWKEGIGLRICNGFCGILRGVWMIGGWKGGWGGSWWGGEGLDVVGSSGW